MPRLTEHQLFRIFHARADDRLLEATERRQRFAYYTNADTAKKVLENRELWLRLPSCMNDFSEIQHGLRMFEGAWGDRAGARLQDALNAVLPDASDRLIEALHGPSVRQLFAETFIACVSEHGSDEEHHGRLSMWRAYGGDSGVALVFSGNVFSSENTGVGAYSSPVEYFTEPEYADEMALLAARIEAATEGLRQEAPEEFFDRVLQAVTLAILCVKHPAFKEEREWRIFSMDALDRGRLISSIECIKGIVQPILKLPFDRPGNMRGTMNELEQVLIGPTQYPIAMRSGFARLLENAAVPDPYSRVCLSEVPLRRD